MPRDTRLIQKTLVLIKPDAVKRGLVGEIISRFEKAGLKIIGMKMVWMSEEMADRFYEKSREWYEKVGWGTINSYKEAGLDPLKEFGTEDPISIGKIVKKWLVKYMTSGPIVAIVLEGVNAVDVVRKLVGHTEPLKAAPGTIRGDFSHMSIAYSNWNMIALRNVVHASDSVKVAEKEISFFFKPEELYTYRRDVEDVIY